MTGHVRPESSVTTDQNTHLRGFFQIVDNSIAVRSLKALWEYREALRQRTKQEDTVENAHGRLIALINRLESRTENVPFAEQTPLETYDRLKLAQIKVDLLSLSDLTPQTRGLRVREISKTVLRRL